MKRTAAAAAAGAGDGDGEALAQAVLAAYQRLPEAARFARVEFDPDTFELRIVAQELDGAFTVVREWDDTPDDAFVLRVAAHTRKQLLSQRLRAAEHDTR